MRLSARAGFALLAFVERLADKTDLKDPDLREALDELRTGKIHARHLKRRPGRPHLGRLRINKARFDELPSVVSLSQAARVLGISYETLRRWSLQTEGFPTFENKPYNALSLRRKELAVFLSRTGRT